jgi:hypothetical protein
MAIERQDATLYMPVIIIIIIIIIIIYCKLVFHPVTVVLTLVHTIQMFSSGGSSPYTSTHNTNGHINIHKNNNTKQTTHNYKTKYI